MEFLFFLGFFQSRVQASVRCFSFLGSARGPGIAWGGGGVQVKAVGSKQCQGSDRDIVRELQMAKWSQVLLFEKGC